MPLPLVAAFVAGIGAAATGYAVYKSVFDDDEPKDSSTPISKPKFPTLLLCGEVAAGKSSVIHWLVNGEFKNEPHDVTVMHKKHEVNIKSQRYDIYDTSGSVNENTERVKTKLVDDGISVTNIYVFDISKLKDKEWSDRIYRGIKLCKDEAEKNGWRAFVIGTHAAKSGLSADEIREEKNKIKIDNGIECEFYELNPDDRREYHPQISKEALGDKILEISSNSYDTSSNSYDIL